MPEFFLSKYEKSYGSRFAKMLILIEKYSAKMATAVIAANDNFKQNLASRGIPAEKITVVYNLPDTKIFDHNPGEISNKKPGENFTLLYPGTIAPRYGLDIPIRALPQLVSDIHNIRYLIIGPPNEHRDELKNLAEQLGVSQYVEFLQPVPTKKIPEQITQADIGVYTALPDPHMSIAVPSKVLEYAIMKTPIIASRLQILTDMFTDKAIMFFEPGNTAQFSKCVLEIYKNPDLGRKLAENAYKEYVSTFDWDKEKGKYYYLLSRLVSIQ
jgi:glycosyltransferase involved in cell wall biosynthesis